MTEKKKLIILKIVRILLTTAMTIMNALEKETPVDTSVLEKEIPVEK